MSKHIENSSIFAQSTGMNMTMIEKVARAICKAERYHQDSYELYLPAAHAAIEAMRESTDEMLKVWNDAGIYKSMPNYYRKSIAAALEGK